MKHTHNVITVKNLASYFLIVLLLIALYFSYAVVEPFVIVLLISAVIAAVFHPLYVRLNRLLKGRRSISALLMCSLITTIIIMPLVLIITMLVQETQSTYHLIETRINDGYFKEVIPVIQEQLNFVESKLSPYIEVQSVDIASGITDFAQTISSYIVSQSTEITKNVLNILFKFLIMLLALYYFFKDGDSFLKKLNYISPLPEKYDLKLYTKFTQVSMATVYGIFGTALFQGIIGGIGFAIVGISSPLFWGTIMTFFALIPFIGAASIWLPAAIILYLKGDFTNAVILFIWGSIFVSSIDNIVRSYLIKGQIHIHVFMTFLSLVGGMISFGPTGLILGPLTLTLFLTILHIYEIEYNAELNH